jgi:outer membrane lipoprotein-sorting protein
MQYFGTQVRTRLDGVKYNHRRVIADDKPGGFWVSQWQNAFYNAKLMKTRTTYLAVLVFLWTSVAAAQSATDIIRRADAKMRGQSSFSEMKMTIVRPGWTREIRMKSWSKGSELALILITAPARDQGTAFLKRSQELWNWQPSIDRTIKMPPSMLLQSWMGSDFTNDDLVKESSSVDDYQHRLLGSETIEGRGCWKIELIPRPNVAVVWGKILMWVDKQDYMQLKAEFYDEDNYLVNTMVGKAVKTLGGQLLPSILEVSPADAPGNKTIVEYISLRFNEAIGDDFFTVQNMRRVR